MNRFLPDPQTVNLQPMPKIPVTILSGFLGSGKTTIIRNFLSLASDTAVIVNEFGEVGIDHLLMETVDENIALLPGGCLCCQAKNDLVRALRSLQARPRPFQRVLVETSGLADPVPILQTFLDDPLRLSQYHLAGLVTTADAILGVNQLAQYQIAQNQIALADRILITKFDIADSMRRAHLVKIITSYNAHAEVEDCAKNVELVRQLFIFESQFRGRWRADNAVDGNHNKSFATFSLNWQGLVDLGKLHAELVKFAHVYEETLLRLKGIINAAGEARPVKIHVVQHLVERPVLLSFSPSDSWRGLVVICKAERQTEILTALHSLLQQSRVLTEREAKYA